MRFLKITGLILLVSILIFAAHTLISTGFFRSIDPQFNGKVLKTVPLRGAEDITVIGQDSIALISATNRVVYPPQTNEEGGIYKMDLKDGSLEPVLLTGNFQEAFAPHGMSYFPKDSGYRIMAISHTLAGHSIEVFDWYGKEAIHVKTLRDPALSSPNDLVMLDENRFYVTNDHGYPTGLGRIVEDYGNLAISNVTYYDGNNFTEVADGISYANGINVDRERQLLYVASPRRFLVKVFQMQEGGMLEFIEDIDCGTGVDNIELDEKGNLWIGCHPNLLRFNAFAKGNRETAPSEIIKISYRDLGDYSVQKVYVDDGQQLSGSTVAAPFGNLILTGAVMDDNFLVLQRE